MKSGRTSLLKLMGTGALLGLLISAVVTCVMPKIYESEAVITLNRFSGGVYSGYAVFGNSVGDTVWDEQSFTRFYAAEFERLKSRESLGKVIESLSLTLRWNVDKEEAIRIHPHIPLPLLKESPHSAPGSNSRSPLDHHGSRDSLRLPLGLHQPEVREPYLLQSQVSESENLVSQIQNPGQLLTALP